MAEDGNKAGNGNIRHDRQATFHGRLWDVLTSIAGVKGKLVFSIRPSALLVILLSALAMLYLHYLWYPQAYDFALLKKQGSQYKNVRWKNTTPILEQQELDLANRNRSSYTEKIIINKRGCQPLYPQMVVYNRIYKTGSTTMSGFFKTCSKKLNIQFETDDTEEWLNEKISIPILSRIQKKAEHRKQINKGHKRGTNGLFVVAHFYFRKDLHVSINYAYINLLREPVARYISNYYYVRSPMRMRERLKRLKDWGHFNDTLEECLDKQHEGCTWNQMTRFFCGPEVFCRNGSSKALERAKYNMEYYYASVGILENLEEFIQVLHKRLPRFVLGSPGLLEKKYVTTGVKKNTVSDIVMKKVINVNRADLELYKFAKTLFKNQAKECGIKINK